MSKRLISVIDIKSLSEQGQTELCVDENTILTPAARDTAMEYGIKVVRGAAAPYTATVPCASPIASPVPSSGASPVVAAGCITERSQAVSPAGKCPPVSGFREGSALITSPWPEIKPTPCSVAMQDTPSSQTVPWPKANPEAFAAIKPAEYTTTAPYPSDAHFVPGQAPVTPCVTATAPACAKAAAGQLNGVDGDLVAQIVKQVMAQMGGSEAPQCDLVRAIDPETGFMLIKGNNLRMEPFNDGKQDRPGITIKELTTPQESPNLTAGFMEFDHADLTWTLTYDEMDYVIDGVLEFIVNGKKYTGYPGDSFFIPMNTTVTFTTPNKAKFFFVTYPANWADSVNAQ